eukprot:scaffold132373_cov30-Tisochrysis_lutea.AAC.3
MRTSSAATQVGVSRHVHIRIRAYALTRLGHSGAPAHCQLIEPASTCALLTTHRLIPCQKALGFASISSAHTCPRSL